MRTEAFLSAALACGAVLCGCPGDLADPGRFADGGATPGTCSDAPKEVFAKSCVTGCHSAKDSATAAGLDLESAGLFARLQDKKAKGGAGLLVDSSAVDKSVLLTKLKSSPPFGAKMPFGATTLSDAQITCVRSWITSELSIPTDAGVTDTGATGGDATSDGADDAAADANAD